MKIRELKLILLIVLFTWSLNPIAIDSDFNPYDGDSNSDNIGSKTDIITQSYAIFANVDIQQSNYNFSYYIQNTDNEAITAFYLLHDAADLIDLAQVSSPIGWEFEVLFPMSLHGDTWTYIVWYLSPSSDPGFAILPGATLGFSYLFTTELIDFQIADGLWSLSNEIGSGNFYQDPLLGQIGNSTEYIGEIDSFVKGLSEVPTIVKSAGFCVIGNNSFPTTYETNHSIPIEFSSQSENYSKDIKTHDYEQGWSPAGNWGCFPTAVGYSLSWWGNHGVGPVDQSRRTNGSISLNFSVNPLNVTDFDSMDELVEELSEDMKTNSINGTNMKNALEGIRKFIKNNSLPLNVTHYDMGMHLANSSGNPNPDNLIDEFMNKREDVTVILAYRGAAHALTLVGMNRTSDPRCGYKISLLDPANGKVITSCMKAQYFDEKNSKWTEDETGTKYGKIWYKGKWRGITGSIAISPADPASVVEDSPKNTNLISNLVLTKEGTIFSYHVSPVPNQGALIDTFAIDTKVKDATLLSDFNVPSGWTTTIKTTDKGFLRIYFHNNLYNGDDKMHLSSDGFTFSFLFSDQSYNSGSWYTTHTGQARLDIGLEDTGIVNVPEEFPNITDTSSPTTTPEVSNSNPIVTSNSEDDQTSKSSLDIQIVFWIITIPIIYRYSKRK